MATVAEQCGNDFEIVVADNASGPEAKLAVDKIKSCPVKYLRTDSVVPMTENWTRGLEACTGEYITILGDDDALLPSTLVIMRRILDHGFCKLIKWNMHTYWWPDAILEHNRNMLFINHSSEIELTTYSNSAMLRGFYDGSVSFGELPMLYNSFVHRSVLSDIKQRWGGFLPLQHVPDVSSGILNLLVTDDHVYCTRPLSIRGNSGKSNGTSFFARSKGNAIRNSHFNEERSDLTTMIHPSLIPSPNLDILIASVKLWARDRFFPERQDLNVDISMIINQIIMSLNNDIDAYDDGLRDAHALALKYNVNINHSAIPAKGPRQNIICQTGIVGSAGKTVSISLDGNLAGVSNIYQASRLAESILPRIL